MAKKKDYIAFVYGTPEDKDKLLALAHADGESASKYLLRRIDLDFHRRFGNTPAKELLPPKDAKG